ncbi:MAG TPA: 50S ribosomal protein L25 [Gemmatimonadales bacterium]|nr:50S ribosomal protein L25 [Gemmatimonadales bacterium]
MEAVTLTAASRTNTGKGAARSLRRDGRIPAVIYGHGRDPLALDLDSRSVERMLDAIGGETVLIDVAIDGAAPVQAIVREVQRNPVRRSDVIHLDLYAIVAGEPIVVDVPVHLLGTPDGVRNQGGVVDHHLHRLTIKCLPRNIPEHVEVDISKLKVGDAIHARDLTVPDAEIQHEDDVSIVSVLAARVEVAPEPVDAVESAGPEVIKKGKADEDEADDES